MEINQYNRQPAIKITINELLKYKLILDQERQSYLLNHENKIFRLNLMGVILKKEEIGSITNFYLDDGTAQIIIRLFEEKEHFKKLNIGDAIIIIGKLRVYNKEKYVSPEIIKKINSLWLKVRSLEFKNAIKIDYEEEKLEELTIKKEQFDLKEENIEEDQSLPFQKISRLIKELDQGEGVLIEEILEKSLLNETEELLEKMMEKGDIFQISPGKVKIL